MLEPWRRGFAVSQRDLPDNLEYVDHFKSGYYDLAILHIDQQSIYRPDEDLRVSKGRLFAELKETIQSKDPDLPIVVINHMTPYHDKYDNATTVKYIKGMVGKLPMIVNSHVARKQWGWGTTITHGLESDDWGYDVDYFEATGKRVMPPKEPRCVIVQSPKGMEKAYRRIFINEVYRKLKEAEVDIVWIGVDKKFNSWDEYRDYLARSLIFFQGAWQSPRPRSRTEAMLSGCCIVTTPYHDADTFIETGHYKDGEFKYDNANGFLTSMQTIKDPRVMDNPDYTAGLIEALIKDRPDIALEVGTRGYEFAKKEFTHAKFESQWSDFLKGILTSE